VASIAPVLAICASFWVALIGFLWRRPDGEGALRHVVGLALGALVAHFGWTALHADRLAGVGWLGWLAPTGFSVLFVPLGPLAAATGLDREARTRFLAAAFGALPLALAVARCGCWIGGCCHGIPTEMPWGVSLAAGTTVHPTSAYEIAALLSIHLAITRISDRWIAPLVLAGVGVARLLVDPWRAGPPLGPPIVPVVAIASALVAGGGVWILVEHARRLSFASGGVDDGFQRRSMGAPGRPRRVRSASPSHPGEIRRCAGPSAPKSAPSRWRPGARSRG